MHSKVQSFIRNKVQESSYLTDPIFAPLEIININDLEQIMDCADSLTLIDLLEEKNGSDPHASDTNFRNFFATLINSREIKSTGWQKKQWEKFGKEILEPNLRFK